MIFFLFFQKYYIEETVIEEGEPHEVKVPVMLHVVQKCM